MTKEFLTSDFDGSKARKQWITFGLVAIASILMGIFSIYPAFAVEGADTVKEVLTQMVDIIGLVFQAAGVILSIYSAGQLVMAFKNEDADSKTRASTMLVVGVILIAMPAIIKGLDLVNKIGN